MKRKYKNIDNDEEDLLEYYGRLYGYLTKRTNDERIFGPPVNVQDTNLDYRHDIFIYNIPTTCYEDRLLPIIFKPGPLHSLRIISNIQKNQLTCAFATYFNIKTADNASILLNNYEIMLGQKLSTIKCRNNNIIYIGNIKIMKVNIYKMLLKLTGILRGVKKITCYAVNNYGRYSLMIEFFRYDDTEYGLRILNCDQMFQIYPEIIVDCTFRSGQRTEPAIQYEWERREDFQSTRPTITILDSLQTHYLQVHK